MAKPPPVYDWPKTQRIIAEAIRNGTHSDTCRVVCPTCGEWVSGIFHIESGGGGGMAGTKRMCVGCAALRGDPDAMAVMVERAQQIPGLS